MKNIAIIGSTGSIGTQALNVVRRYKERFKVVALTANDNIDLLIRQTKEFEPEFVATANPLKYSELKANVKCECGAGEDALIHATTIKSAELVLMAVVGMRGLKLLLKAVESGKNIALANKESLVAGGELVMPLVQKKGIMLYPVDSEHSAVWQCLHSGQKCDLKRVILTASGGPFYGKTLEELENVTPEQAVRHPNWQMGKKISVDSATMMNKGLELIEARWLFNTTDVDYVIHRKSIVHSMVEFNDGAVIAQLSNPDMELPIQLAFTYPDRLPLQTPPLQLNCNLDFALPDEKNFPLPHLAKQVMTIGGNLPCILNAANEAAVQLFLNGKIKFPMIFEIVQNTCASAKVKQSGSLQDLLETHHWVTEKLMRDYIKTNGA